MKRAVHDDQKTERRQAILTTTATLILEKGYEELTLTEVATRLGLVKGTLYRYFATKETLVLEVLERELVAWAQRLEAELPPGIDLAALATWLADSLAERPLLVRLFSVVHIWLEKNLTVERLAAFKHLTATILDRGATKLETALPALAGHGTDFLLSLYELAIGIGHLTDRTPAVDQALHDPQLGIFRLDFRTELTKNLIALLKGFTSR